MENTEKGNAVLSANIRRLLEIKHKSKSALANALGISRQAIQKYVDGEAVPNADRLLAIADFFNVSVDFLMGRTKFPKLANPSAQSAIDYCGLSVAAAERLHCAAASPNPGEHNQAAAVNALLEYKHGHVVLELIDAYIHFSYDAFRRDGNVYSTVGLIHSEDPDGEGLLVRPSTVKAALLSEISTQLALLSEELKRGNNNGQH